MTGTRVVLADDDVLLREGLASLLERSGFAVVGQAGDGGQVLPVVRETTPELVVVDIRMPPTYTVEGLDAARQIRQELPETGILVLSAHTDVEHAMELLASGRGIGYLLKSRITDVAEFLDTLERIAKGGSVVDPALVQELVSARRAGLGQEPARRARRDQVGVVLLGVRGDQDHRSACPVRVALKAPGDLEAALSAQIDVDQRDVRPQLVDLPHRLGAGRGHPDHRDALAFQQATGSVQEVLAVIDDQAAEHDPNMA